VKLNAKEGGGLDLVPARPTHIIQTDIFGGRGRAETGRKKQYKCVGAWTLLYAFGIIEGSVCFISSEGGANPIPVFLRT
jgi:hypothetical protein